MYPVPERQVPAIGLEWAPGFTADLVSRLAAVKEPELRALALADRFSELSDDDIIAVASRLYDLALAGTLEAFDVLACLQNAHALTAKLGRERMQEISNQARIAGRLLIAEMLRPAEKIVSVGTRTHRDLRELTLGHRKALARSPEPEMLAKLLEDDHPHVQELLLANPRLLVRDVIGVAARRPALPHVLRGIARHRRWMHNHEVQRTLALNPESPIDVSARILPLLAAGDLQEISANRQVHPTVRRLAESLLEKLPPQQVQTDGLDLGEHDSLDDALAELGVEYMLGSPSVEGGETS